MTDTNTDQQATNFKNVMDGLVDEEDHNMLIHHMNGDPSKKLVIGTTGRGKTGPIDSLLDRNYDEIDADLLGSSRLTMKDVNEAADWSSGWRYGLLMVVVPLAVIGVAYLGFILVALTGLIIMELMGLIIT